MSAQRLFVMIFLASVGCTPLMAQMLSPTTAPQQMVPSSAPSYPYPSTLAGTASYPPTTSYPSTTPSYPSTYPSTYPSLAQNDLTPQGRVAPAPSPNDPNAVYPLVDSETLSKRRESTPSELFANNRPLDVNSYVDRNLGGDEPWTWQILPTGLMYKSYLADTREARMGSQWVHDRNSDWFWDATLGARIGMLRYGTDNDLWPQGWQLDIEGAAFPRLNMDHERDVDDVDFRAGMVLTTRQGPVEFKFGYAHFCSHIGDEYLLRHPTYERTNYVQECAVGGMAVYLNPSLRLYGEVDYAFATEGGAKPWGFRVGADYSSPEPTGACGAPFFAVNGHLREENDYGGNVSIQTGWQWRGRTGHLLRLGMQYFNGMSEQWQFIDRFEEQIGMGLWYDF
ncbi:MAG: DUF1207 domain-containing protein [Planctomycetaceae bacterium]|nr:DUF1207 domain-containing protein [Planctomycetaceae bacterium]